MEAREKAMDLVGAFRMFTNDYEMTALREIEIQKSLGLIKAKEAAIKCVAEMYDIAHWANDTKMVLFLSDVEKEIVQL